MVPGPGIEPGLPKKQDFKSCVSTNSTIRAKVVSFIFSSSKKRRLKGIYIIFYITQCFLKVLIPLAETLILKTKPVSGSFIFL